MRESLLIVTFLLSSCISAHSAQITNGCCNIIRSECRDPTPDQNCLCPAGGYPFIKNVADFDSDFDILTCSCGEYHKQPCPEMFQFIPTTSIEIKNVGDYEFLPVIVPKNVSEIIVWYKVTADTGFWKDSDVDVFLGKNLWNCIQKEGVFQPVEENPRPCQASGDLACEQTYTISPFDKFYEYNTFLQLCLRVYNRNYDDAATVHMQFASWVGRPYCENASSCDEAQTRCSDFELAQCQGSNYLCSKESTCFGGNIVQNLASTYTHDELSSDRDSTREVVYYDTKSGDLGLAVTASQFIDGTVVSSKDAVYYRGDWPETNGP